MTSNLGKDAMARHYYGHATAAVFAPFKPMFRAEFVIRRLRDAIALGLLPDGTQLPGEADLAASLGVSTVTVREALAALRNDGLLQTRRGRGGGSFIALPPGGASAIIRRRLQSLSLMDLRDLGDFYAAVSGAAAAYAAQRGTPDEIDQIRGAAERFAAAADVGARRQTDARLRLLIATTAQSPRLYAAEVELQAEIGTLLRLTFELKDAFRHDAELVTELVVALRAADAARARHAAEQRVRAATARLTELRIDLERP